MKKLTDEEKQKRAFESMKNRVLNKEGELETALMHLVSIEKSTRYIDVVIKILNVLKKDLEEELADDLSKKNC